MDAYLWRGPSCGSTIAGLNMKMRNSWCSLGCRCIRQLYIGHYVPTIACSHACTYVCTYVHTYTRTHIHTYMCKYAYPSENGMDIIRVNDQARAAAAATIICMHVCMCVYTYTHILTYIHTRAIFHALHITVIEIIRIKALYIWQL